MKKIIPITKEITFRTMIGEMTEVSLEHTLNLVDPHTVEGNLVVKGRYKMTEASTIEEDYSEEVPLSIEVDEKYDTKDLEVLIDDFYYEIINENILRIHVDVALDGLTLKEEEEEPLEVLEEEVRSDVDSLPSLEEVPEVMVEEVEVVPPAEEVPVEVEEKVESVEVVPELGVNSIFSALENTDETFSTYSVYLVQEGDTIDSILSKYNATKEDLQDYNNLDEIKIGSKLIIPGTLKDEAH